MFKINFIVLSLILIPIGLSGCATNNGLNYNNSKYNKSISKDYHSAIISNVIKNKPVDLNQINNEKFIKIRNSQKYQKNNFLDYEEKKWNIFTQKDKDLFLNSLKSNNNLEQKTENSSSWVYKNGKYVKINQTIENNTKNNEWKLLVEATIRQSRFCNDRNFSPYIISYFEKLNNLASNCSDNHNCLNDKNIRELKEMKNKINKYFNDQFTNG